MNDGSTTPETDKLPGDAPPRRMADTSEGLREQVRCYHDMATTAASHKYPGLRGRLIGNQVDENELVQRPGKEHYSWRRSRFKKHRPNCQT